MKIIKKIFAGSPKVNETAEAAVTSEAVETPKTVVISKAEAAAFLACKEKMKGLAGNFRQKAEQAGVPPERVRDFKYWLRENYESR